jgi:O-succinylbenzoate synthase
MPDPARLAALTAAPDRRDWWIERVIACYRLLS